MNKTIRKIAISVIFMIFCILINTISEAVTPLSGTFTGTDGNEYTYDASGNGYVTDYDFAKLATQSKWFYGLPAEYIRGKYIYINQGGTYGEGYETINQSHAICMGHGNTKSSARDTYSYLYKISTVLDIEPTQIKSYINGQVGPNYSTVDPFGAITTLNANGKYSVTLTADSSKKTGTDGASEFKKLNSLARYIYYVGNSTATENASIIKFFNANKSNFAKKYLVDGTYKYSYSGSTSISNSDYEKKVSNHKFIKNEISTTPDRHSGVCNNTTYDYYGPFQITRSSDIEKISVSISGGGKYIGIASKVGGEPKDANTDTIKSNTSFYVVTDVNTSSSKRTITIKGETGKDFYKARLIFLKHTLTSGGQNLLIYRADETSLADTVKYEITPSEKKGNLRIIKGDGNERTTGLSGATFKIKNDKGKYIKADMYNKNDEKISEFSEINYYKFNGGLSDTETGGTTFKTRSNGFIDIKNLPEGYYYIIEKAAPENYDKTASSSKGIKTYVRPLNRYTNKMSYLKHSIQTALNTSSKYDVETLYKSIMGKSIDATTKKKINTYISGKGYNSNDYSSKINAVIDYIFDNNIIKNETIVNYTNLENAIKVDNSKRTDEQRKLICKYLTYVYNTYYNTDLEESDLYIYCLYTRTIQWNSKTIWNYKKSNPGKLMIIKGDNADHTKPLAGAKFQVTNVATEEKVKADYVKDDDTDSNKYEEKENSQNTTFETGTDGKILIVNLEPGKYRITEIAAPEGYNKDNNTYDVTVYSEDEFDDKNAMAYAIKYMLNGQYFDSSSEAKLKESIEKTYKNILRTDKVNGETVAYMLNKLKNSTNTNNKKEEDTIQYIFDKHWSAIEKIINNYNASNNTNKIRLYIKDLYNGYYTSKVDSIDNLYMVSVYYKTQGWASKNIYNSPKVKTGNLTIWKEDDKGNPLMGVVFYIKNSEGKYLNINKNQNTFGNIPTTFFTDKDGLIEINNLPYDKYYIVEVGTGPNIDYEVPKDENGKNVEIEVILEKEEVETTIVNYPKTSTISLSGYAWIDKHEGKNNISDNRYDDEDKKINGVTVYLKDQNGEIVENEDGTQCVTTTHTVNEKDGYYQFDKIKKNQLTNYYIEFEYNGMSYQVVESYNELNKANTNKAREVDIIEGFEYRDSFNEIYNTIDSSDTYMGLEYEKEGHSSYLIVGNNAELEKDKPINNVRERYLIQSDTAGYILQGTDNDSIVIGTDIEGKALTYKDIYEGSIDEITNINLGLYEREQPDVRLQKDIYSATVSVNGKSYDYMYNKVPVDTGTSVDTSIGISFANKNGKNPYKLPIYRADYSYQNSEDVDGSFKTYITYKIALVNEATNIYSVINSIQDTYDSEHMKVDSYQLVNEEGDTVKEEKITEEKVEKVPNSNYSTFTLSDLNIKVKPKTAEYIYIKYQLISGSEYDGLIGNEIQNFAEITSYSSYSDKEFNTPYGGVDEDSAPGNLDINKYNDEAEDDSDRAPGLKIVQGDRSIKGIVFEDSTEPNEFNGRVGDGIYTDSTERGIAGVKVGLYKIDAYGNITGEPVVTKETGEDGTFTISDFVAGNYKIVYTWGDGENYNALNYKSTIVNENDWKNPNEASKWYINDVDTRKSDAIDDWTLREQIDGINNETRTTTITSNSTAMNSYTNAMDIGIEAEDYNESSIGDDGIRHYAINNIDFGIAERAKQSLSLIKHANNIKVVLANGQELVNTPIKYENGEPKIENPTKGLTAIGVNKNGVVKYEIDSELIQGASIEIGYSLILKNTSEYDEENEKYYNYGEVQGNPIELKANKIIDYLDERLPYSENEGWEIIKESDIGEYEGVQSDYNKPGDIIKGDGTYTYSQILSSKEEDKWNIALKPDDKEITLSNLKFSKLLSNTDDTTFDNLAEIVSVTRTGGTVPTKVEEGDTGWAETVVVTPPTGENHNYIAIIATTFISLVALAGGIFLIKKKVIK